MDKRGKMGISDYMKKGVENSIFLVLIGVIITLGFIQGSRFYTVQVKFFSFVFELIWINAVSSSISFSLFMLFSALSFFVRLRGKTEEDEDYEPSVSVLIPAYREAAVLDNAVESVLETGYDDLEILVICEEDDQETVDRAEHFESEKVEVLVNNRYSGSKAGALNYGSEEAEGEVLAFFDADQEIDEDFFSDMLPDLKKQGVVKSRQIPQPDGFVESLAYYESVFFTYIARELLYRVTDFRLVGSRSVMIKKEVFEDLGGYSEDVMTEDYLFSHKCYKQGIPVKSVPRVSTKEQAAHSFRDWWGQRIRWMTGYFQVFYHLLKDLISNPTTYRDLIAAVISGASILGSVFMLFLVSKFFILVLLGAEEFYMVPLATISLIGLTFRFYDYSNQKVDNIGVSWIFIFMIFPFFALVTLKSFFNAVGGNESWYHVRKRERR